MDAYTMNADDNDILAVGDIVVTVAHDPTVIALDAADGTERWQYRVSDEDYGGVNGLAAGDGAVYAGGIHGLVALEATDGSVRWEYVVDGPDSPNPQWGGFFSPVAIGGSVYGATRVDDVAGKSTFQLVALDAATGAERWALPLSSEQMGAPVSDGTLVVVEYYTLEDDLRWPNLGAFDALTGESRWVAEIRDVEKWPTSRPVVTADLVYLGDQSGDVVARSAIDGSREWRTNVGANVETLTAVDGTVYVTTPLSEVHALNANTGKKRWHAKPKGEARITSAAMPAVVQDGPVIVGAADHDGGAWLYAFDPKKGKQLWRVDSGPSGSGFMAPIVSGGRVVVGMHDPSGSRVVSFGTP
jgi:outer membrane protein assembly factor BamB